MLIQEWAVGHFLVVLDINKIRGTFGGGGVMGSTIEKYILNTSMCKFLTRVLVRGNIRGGLGDHFFFNNGKFPVILCR